MKTPTVLPATMALLTLLVPSIQSMHYCWPPACCWGTTGSGYEEPCATDNPEFITWSCNVMQNGGGDVYGYTATTGCPATYTFPETTATSSVAVEVITATVTQLTTLATETKLPEEASASA